VARRWEAAERSRRRRDGAPTMVAVTAAASREKRLRVASTNRCQHSPCTQMAPQERCARVGGCGWAYLCPRRRSRRSARPSEPSFEAGTRPSDGQGCTLESAHPRGIATSLNHAVHGNRVACAVYDPVSRKTRAQSVPDPATIMRICGVHKGMLDSKLTAPGCSNNDGVRRLVMSK
jgi:hypothetical protein